MNSGLSILTNLILIVSNIALWALLAKHQLLSGKREPSPKNDAPPLEPVHDPCAILGHALIPIDAQLLTGDNLLYTQTVCLKRCPRCGFHQVYGYAGDWKIEDFMKTHSDVAELERIAAK